MRSRGSKLWAGVAIVVLLTAGCSAGDASKASRSAQRPEVATLETPTPLPGAAGRAQSGSPGTSNSTRSAADPEAERPRERIDMTQADRERLYAPYLQCLHDHGVVLNLKPKPPGSHEGRVQNPQNIDQADRACAAKLPLPPWEVDANNPDALDFGRKVVQCLKDKGVRYVELSNGNGSGIVGPALGGPNNDPESIRKGLELEPACQREVAGK